MFVRFFRVDCESVFFIVVFPCACCFHFVFPSVYTAIPKSLAADMVAGAGLLVPSFVFFRSYFCTFSAARAHLSVCICVIFHFLFVFPLPFPLRHSFIISFSQVSVLVYSLSMCNSGVLPNSCMDEKKDDLFELLYISLIVMLLSWFLRFRLRLSLSFCENDPADSPSSLVFFLVLIITHSSRPSFFLSFLHLSWKFCNFLESLDLRRPWSRCKRF